MKIELITDLPIDKEHGCTEGRCFEVVDIGEGRNKLYYFKGDIGEVCAAFGRECVVVKENVEVPE